MRLTTMATALALAGALGLIQPSPAEAQRRDTRQGQSRSYRPTPSRRDHRSWRQTPRHRNRRPAPRYDRSHRYSPRYRPAYRGSGYRPYRYYGHRHYGPCRPGYRCYPAPYHCVPRGYYLDGVPRAGFGLHLSGPHGGVHLGTPGLGVYLDW